VVYSCTRLLRHIRAYISFVLFWQYISNIGYICVLSWNHLLIFCILIYHIEVDASQDSGALSNDDTDSMAAFFGGKRRTETAMLGFFFAFFRGERQTETAMLGFFQWRSSGRVSNGSNGSILTSCWWSCCWRRRHRPALSNRHFLSGWQYEDHRYKILVKRDKRSLHITYGVMQQSDLQSDPGASGGYIIWPPKLNVTPS
jgi:hypothetical protein